MISRAIKVIYGVEPSRNSAASPSSVRHPYLTFLSSRIHLRFKPFGALVMSMLSLDKLARPVNAAEVIERLTAIGHLERSEVLQLSQAYVTTPTVVGRERELGIFRTRMLNALRGRGSTVVLEGEPGEPEKENRC